MPNARRSGRGSSAADSASVGQYKTSGSQPYGRTTSRAPPAAVGARGGGVRVGRPPGGGAPREEGGGFCLGGGSGPPRGRPEKVEMLIPPRRYEWMRDLHQQRGGPAEQQKALPVDAAGDAV